MLVLLGLLGLAATAGFGGLGIWQVGRLGWKLALIERVESRIHAPPVAAPGPERWATIATDEYRWVKLNGHFLNERETLVQAVTEHGGGSWVMTPFQSDLGFTVLVNRGFVPPERRDPASRSAGQAEGDAAVTGLLRLSEPKGGFLRENDPAAGRWYSRDVEAIAVARSLGTVAPYFIDADATPNPGGFPIGGLTVVRFSNNHLAYALTWFALALMVAGATIRVIGGELLRRRGRGGADMRLTAAAR
ncbi:SURF1 family protein [Bosea caraganae]|uniref:SURF1-like protein n=1 Tax=Bosea caraganae TaxID=2763117 RepID=A0A370LD90_9HYPH|nr:SURF1 family protein [Bosea caraganae]RDJ27911.1 SURF1 family protein [Bosea caraganae]RDJ29926.1 SURF1 family protein [Bosea caraganae]